MASLNRYRISRAPWAALLLAKTACAPIGHLWARPRAIRPKRFVWVWRPRSTTGACTLGAIYAVVGLALALFSYNKGLPLTIRSAFYPILGERVWGWPGHVIDILAVFATLFGLATSLGLGATQANAGLNELFGVAVGPTTQVLLITGITAIATVSVLRGLDGGVKVLSEINMGLAFFAVGLRAVGRTDAGDSVDLRVIAAGLCGISARSSPIRSAEKT